MDDTWTLVGLFLLVCLAIVLVNIALVMGR